MPDLLATLLFAAGLPLLLVGCAASAYAVRRAREQALTERDESRERFQRLAEHSGALIREIDLQGRLVYASPNHATILGWSPEEVAARHDKQVAFWQTNSPSNPDSSLHEVQSLDGQRRWLETESVFVQSGDGTRLLSISRDVTARVEADRALREREESLRNAQRIAHIGSFDWWIPDNRLEFSDEQLRIFGFEDRAGTVEMSDFYERIHPEDRQRFLDATTDALNGGPSPDLEFRIVRPSGDVRIVHGRGEVERDDRGRPLRLRGTALDVTDRTRVQEALRASEERNRAVLSSLGDTRVVLFGLDSRIVAIYGGPEEWRHGAPDGRVVRDRPLDAFLSAEQAQIGKQLLDEVASSGSLRRMRIPATLGTRQFWFDLGLSPVHGRDGSVEYVLAVVREVTEEVRAQREHEELGEQLRQTQKLESLGVLAGGIAHDFNNLLVGIRGNAELALAQTPVASDARGYLSDIELASDRAAELTERLLAYAGKGKLMAQTLRLSPLVLEVRSLLRTSVAKTADLRFDLAEAADWVHVDPAQLRQILMNITINAGDALGGRAGEVVVRTGVVDVDAAYLARCSVAEGIAPGRFAYLEVEDDGEGIDEEALPRIFDPFFTTKLEGRGLGLAAVLGIARSHGGTVRVDSTAGRGTLFRVLLPIVPEPAPSRVTVREEAPAEGRGTILIVDDERMVRSVAAQMLRHDGFEVVETSGGPNALEWMAGPDADPIRCVLLDVTMPGMDGPTTFRALRERFPELPVLFMSGHSASDLSEIVEGYERIGRLRKPFRIADLRREIAALLGEEC